MVSSIARGTRATEDSVFKDPSYGWQAIMFYTYVLESLAHPKQHYVGHTEDLRDRLAEHNAGKSPHTSRHVPWKVKCYMAFETLELARNFEHYLKSGSGHAFAHRHLGY
jgi:predicted GIY-YIG superfamily endonuclease